MRLRGPLAAAIVAASLTAGAARPVVAQSLAELARQEEARRKAIKEPAKVYTNKDLGNVPPAPTPPAPPPPPAVSTSAPANDTEADKNKAEEPAKDQVYWAGRLRALQQQLDRDQVYADALQSRINALTADFTARADPAQRAVIGRDRQRAVDELNRLQQTIQTDKKAIADLQEEARRAGVPPGWLR